MKRQVLSILVFGALLISCQNNARLGDSGVSAKDSTPAVTASVDDTTGDNATGDEPTGDEPTGDEPTGDEPTGDEPTGDEPTGDEPTGDEPTGDEPTAVSNAVSADAINQAMTKSVLEKTKGGNLEDIYVSMEDGKPVVKYFKLKGAEGYSLVTPEMLEECGDFDTLITHLNSEVSVDEVKVSKEASEAKDAVDQARACLYEQELLDMTSISNINKIFNTELAAVNALNSEHPNNTDNVHEAFRRTELVLAKNINEVSKAYGSKVVVSNLQIDQKFENWNNNDKNHLSEYKKVSMDYDTGVEVKPYSAKSGLLRSASSKFASDLYDMISL